MYDIILLNIIYISLLSYLMIAIDQPSTVAIVFRSSFAIRPFCGQTANTVTFSVPRGLDNRDSRRLWRISSGVCGIRPLL